MPEFIANHAWTSSMIVRLNRVQVIITKPYCLTPRAMKRPQASHGQETPQKSKTAKTKGESKVQDPPVQQHATSPNGESDETNFVRLQQCLECKDYLPELEGDTARRIGDLSIVWLCWQCKLSKWHKYVQHNWEALASRLNSLAFSF